MIALLMLLFFLGTFAVVLYLGKKKEKGKENTEDGTDGKEDPIQFIKRALDEKPWLKTLSTIILIIFALWVLFPDEFQNALEKHREFVLILATAIGILFILGTGADSQFFQGLAKWFSWGLISYLIFMVLVSPNVDFEKIGGEVDERLDSPRASRESNQSLPPNLRVGPHTNVSPVKYALDGRLEFIKVSIDGTNEFDRYPTGKRRGHDTTVDLNPGECVEVQWQVGRMSYLTQTPSGEYKSYQPPISGGDSWRTLGEGYTAFYPYENTRNSILLVLWRLDAYEVFGIPGAHDKVVGCNSSGQPADVFLFFNTPELVRERLTGIQNDTFPYNGWDGSRAVFDVKLCKETISEMENARLRDCSI